jgi:molecular chaperone GrpE
MAEETKRDNMDEEQTGGETSQEPTSRLRWRRRENDAARGKEAGAAVSDADADLVSDLQEQIGAERTRADDLKQQVLRAQADFANYRRRIEQEREQQSRLASWAVVRDIVPILDNIDLTLANMPEEVRGLPWTSGLLLVDRQLRATLEKQGLKPIEIEPVGTLFNPTLHEAIMHEESSTHADNEIIAELRRGYLLHDKVVRPTLVKVAKHVGVTEQTQEEK